MSWPLKNAFYFPLLMQYRQLHKLYHFILLGQYSNQCGQDIMMGHGCAYYTNTGLLILCQH